MVKTLATAIGRWSDLTGGHEISALEAGMDFRQPAYRRAVFKRFYDFHIRYRSHPGCVYYLMPQLADRMEMDEEAKLWFAFLNGNTQNPLTSYLIFERFPEPSTKMQEWFDSEWARLHFDVDRRYQKQLLPKACANYAEQINRHGSQQEYFEHLRHERIGKQAFPAVWNEVRNHMLGFGRLSAFSYTEYLWVMGQPIECSDLFLKDLSGSKSHRNGLSLVLGRDDMDWHDSNPSGFDGSYGPGVLNWLESEADALLSECRSFSKNNPYYEHIGYHTFESALCTYKSWHRPNRRYPNCYNDMLHDRIKQAEQVWTDTDFSLFWQIRQDVLPKHLRLEDNPSDCGLKPSKQNHYLRTGQVIMMHNEWPEFANDWNVE